MARLGEWVGFGLMVDGVRCMVVFPIVIVGNLSGDAHSSTFL